ncbi:hypothetical protein IMZ31_23225 (plasmid) [Pontibacillus sp. ALD_SL1]|uniref:DUF948 domain-containing protein n=1 Tax=Pontibacillus sp. ALD_SL1 TaxID=2777185 RepID=UPI001A96A45B|nr:DUF948 domain-containing protein [Pontibacillus sp. ALD_SL1]QST02365.1 hypothetical protein IMZ31_23225 [Pontibacillus sp. ALD_SL1]
MTVIELSVLAASCAFIVLVGFIITTLQKLNSSLEKVDALTENIQKKAQTIDSLLKGASSIDKTLHAIGSALKMFQKDSK